MIRILILILVLFTSPLISEESNSSGKHQLVELQKSIDKIIRESASDVNVGIEIISLTKGQKLYQKSPQNLFVPASCLKMITSAVALYELGVDYQFVTKLFADGKVENKILKGNLYLQGSGDPELAPSDLEEIVFQLKLLNIQSIEGNLYIDNTLFDRISQGPGWMWDEGSSSWNSPMGALTLNHSCVDIWVAPAAIVGKAPNAYAKTDYVAIQNHAITAAEEDSLSVDRLWMERENTIEVKGQIPLASKAQHFMIAVEDPSLYAGHVFREILLKSGFAFTGKIEIRATPQEAILIGAHLSRRLSQIVENLASDCLFKKLGERRYGAPGTWQKGAQAVQEFLKTTVGLSVDKMVILDGSGLSRYNLLSAHQFVEFLSWVYAQSDWSLEFLAALPIAGTDGTLSNRMTESDIKGKVRAKTGAMTGISSLSGFATTKEGEVLAFSILENGFTGKVSEYRTNVEDQICRLLVNFSCQD
jgi:D-alanyl-D-alanine carboxypeptidase/D-alanyl-D-alanine-endopeptidase (penicillin-binding protein 4)